MIRRFVNLVAQKPRSNNGAYSLHRLNVGKHLFYPSIAEAEAANAKAQSNGGGGDDGKPPKQPVIGSLLRRLPKPTVQFQQVPPTPTWRPLDDMFVLLSPGGVDGSAAATGDRILHASKEGHGDVYDADSGSIISTMPSPTLDGPNRVGVQPITFSIAGTDGQKQDSRRLYVMTDHGGQNFQCLDLSQHPLKWQPLPPAPFAVAAAAPSAASCITSFTAVDVDGGSTIWVSTVAMGTYCFDTRTNEWRHAGDWVLPFDGRAQYVPELDAWLGFSSRRVNDNENDSGHDDNDSSHDEDDDDDDDSGRGRGHDHDHHQLCASSDLAAAMDAGRAPTLDHVWEDLVLPRDHEKMKLGRRFGEFEIERWNEWYPYGYFPHGGHRLINLGGGRFCVAKAFRLKQLRDFETYCYCDIKPYEFATQDLVVLSGVEVLRDGGDGGRTRMVKHKSIRYNMGWDDDQIKSVL